MLTIKNLRKRYGNFQAGRDAITDIETTRNQAETGDLLDSVKYSEKGLEYNESFILSNIKRTELSGLSP